jgi:hypothetical protein
MSKHEARIDISRPNLVGDKSLFVPNQQYEGLAKNA